MLVIVIDNNLCVVVNVVINKIIDVCETIEITHEEYPDAITHEEYKKIISTL